ncbi:MAG: pantoate--beta-alanine ligase [Gammaproteobacteria bacterium]|nr:pantoate--beta-alanine ligase [Gammaproteobacteria bacterium]
MEILTAPAAVRDDVAHARGRGASVALVPTMGDLHDGHLSLVTAGRRRADVLVASIFVNPLQFGPGEDFQSYPRALERDAGTLEAAGVDLLFAPTAEAIYPRGLAATTRVEVPELTSILCGAARPGHFTGVATVVNILFNIVRPDLALFGEKDYQQLRIIRRMVADLQMDVEVVGLPTRRAPDGLALSSRNRYLSVAERVRAPQLYYTLRDIALALERGARDTGALERDAAARLAAAGFTVDYVSIREAETLASPGPGTRAFVVLGAARLGAARLIDNVAATAANTP